LGCEKEYSNGKLKFTRLYARYAQIIVSSSCILTSGTNQLLTFGLRINGIKYPFAAVKVLFTLCPFYSIRSFLTTILQYYP
jgi:hypothetical protein